MSDLPERGIGDGSEGGDNEQSSDMPGPRDLAGGGQDSSFNVSGACSQPTEGVNPVERVSGYESSKPSLKSDRNWTANAEILDQIISMGISKDKAVRALYRTGNNSAEAAISWIFENGDAEGAEIPELENVELMHFKMVFAVNCSLNMGIGKTAAQVAHAALGLQMFLLENDITYGNQLTRWNESGETKVVLKAESAEQLNILAAKAQSLRLPNYLVADAGRTQIPAGSITVLSIFGRIDLVDQVTGQLKLL